LQTRNVHAELFQSTPLHEGRPRPSMPVTSSRWQFQSTPLHEGRLYHRNKRRHRLPVSIHAPARGATDFAGLGMVPLKFQSTPLHEGRRYGIRTSGRRLAFQSTPLHEGRRESNLTPPKDADKFQSTPLHEGRQRDARVKENLHGVSIHAPARGATEVHLGPDLHGRVSIHAPARGATPLCLRGTLAQAVSIHAPARGATRSSVSGSTPMRFQSTPLHEGRLAASDIQCVFTRFNPRPCTRGDAGLHHRVDLRVVSIHAPARGATESVLFRSSTMSFNPRPCTRGDTEATGGGYAHKVSIHAPARGATQIIPVLDPLVRVSIHAPARGATSGSSRRPRRRPVSIHAPARGATAAGGPVPTAGRCFNPRPCTRGDATRSG